jgi:hypothetical protein
MNQLTPDLTPCQANALDVWFVVVGVRAIEGEDFDVNAE